MSTQGTTLNEKLVAARSRAVLEQTPASKVVKAALDSVLTKLEVALKAPSQKNKPLSEDQVLDVVAATSKEYQKSIMAFTEALTAAATSEAKQACHGKIDAIKAEQTVLAEYLPAQMTEVEVRTIVAEILTELNITDAKKAGMVVGVFSKRYPKQADGKVVLTQAQELLSTEVK